LTKCVFFNEDGSSCNNEAIKSVPLFDSPPINPICEEHFSGKKKIGMRITNYGKELMEKKND